jgi:hypothetical protein
VPYSAGTAWLQVVPSFLHIQSALERDVKKLATSIDNGLRAALPEAMRRGVADGSERITREGTRAGRDYSDAFTETFRRRVDRSLKALAEPQIGAARNAAEQSVRDLREDLRDLREQHIRLEIDDDQAIEAIRDIRQRMLAAEREIGDRASVINLRVAGGELDAFEDLVRQAGRSGNEAGGNFGGAFGTQVRRTFAQVLKDLPDIALRPDLGPFEREMRKIRSDLTDLSQFRIGIDGDADQFFAQLTRVRAAMQALRDEDVSVDFNVNLDRGLAALRRFEDETAGDAGRDAGEHFAGMFDDTVGRRIDAALQSLPDVEVDADVTPAMAEIQRIKTELGTVRDLRINGTLNADQVLARLAVLQARLDAMSRKDVDIQVRVDAAGAAAQLAAIAALAGGLNEIGDAAQINIGRLGAMIAAGLSIGTVLVPAAAAAAVAVGAIGTAAIAAASGVGVLILGFSGVVTGLKAMNKFQQDANKSAKSLSQSHAQVENAVDGVAAAERSLGNVRENVAQGAQQAARAVVDAQRQVTDAQREARQAQLDLIEAVKQARQLDEDRALQLRGNALDQRQATLDIADAKAELDKVLANPKATQAEREQAQVAFEQRMLQLEQLKVSGKRLAEQQAEAAKAGVNGSEQVVQAQDRVRSSAQQVQDAQQRVADAQAAQAEQQRQGAFQIAQAVKGLTTAQRSLQQASVAAGVAGGEALDNLNDAMKDLSPTAQAFVKDLFGMRDAALGLRHAAEEGMLPGVDQALHMILPLLPLVQDFIFRIAQGLGEIAVEAVHSLQHPVWQEFFRFIDSTAVPTMKILFSSSEAVARGVAALFLALTPFNRQIGKGLIDLTQGFAMWAERLTASNGYQQFLAYVARVGPKIVDDIAALAQFTGRLVIAAAPLGEAVADSLGLLLRILNAIPTPILSEILFLIGALSLAMLIQSGIMKGWSSVTGVANNIGLAWTKTQIGLAAVAARVTAANTAAATSTTLYGRAMGAAGAASATTLRGLSAMTGFLGGPWGIALTIAGLAIGELIGETAKAHQNIQKLRDSMNQLSDIFKEGFTRDALANSEALLRQDSGLRRLLDTMHQAGFTTQQVVQAINGEQSARDELVHSLNEQYTQEVLAADAARGSADHDNAAAKQHRDRARALDQMRKALVDTSTANQRAAELTAKLSNEELKFTGAVKETQSVLDGSRGGFDAYKSALGSVADVTADSTTKAQIYAQLTFRVGESQLTAAQKTDLFGSALSRIEATGQTSGPVFDSLAGIFTEIAQSSINAKDKVSLLKQAMDKMFGAAISQFEADEQLVRSQSELTRQLITNSAGFDLNSARTGGNTEAILANIDVLKSALGAAREKYLQDIANGVAEEQARAQHDKTTQTIIAQIDPVQRNSSAVQDLNRRYGEIPPVKKTDVSTPGLDKAILDLVTAHAVQIGLSQSPPWTRALIDNEIDFLMKEISGRGGSPAMFKAEGGLIPGYSPHRSADNILAMVTADEYIQPVDTVRHYGVDVMERLRRREIPREALSHFATGGPAVGNANLARWPVTMKPTVTMKPSLADLWAQWESARANYLAGLGNVGAGPGFLPWPSSPEAQRGDTGVWRSIVALVRSSGIPFSFGDAYRAGDPLWHGSGRAVDFMGYNQDDLAQFFIERLPNVLELIHTTDRDGYYVTRGRRYANFPVQGPLHRNHLHIAMDQGGWLQPGWNPPIWNGTGEPEPVLSPEQWQAVSQGAQANAGMVGHTYNFAFRDTTLDAGKLRALQTREAVLARQGRAH